MPLLDSLRAALDLNPVQQQTWESFTQVIAPNGQTMPTFGVPAVTGLIGTLPTKLFSSAYVPAYYVVISPRTMATSAWVRVGNIHGQVTSLYAVTDVLVLAGPSGQPFDASQLFGISQFGDVTLEITGLFP